MPTLTDIMAELEKPGRDPREQLEEFEFDPNVSTPDDLVEGMVLPGIVTNITNFGAFVDIGVHQDGLVHISQLADRYVSDPTGCQITSARNGEGYRGRPQTQQNIAFDESRRQVMPKADRLSEGIYDVCKTEKGHILPPTTHDNITDKCLDIKLLHLSVIFFQSQ